MATTARATVPAGKAGSAEKSAKDAETDELHAASRDLLIAMKAAGVVDHWLDDATVGAALIRLKSAVIATAPAPTVIDVPYASQSEDLLTLSCTMGNWTDEPTSYGYQWQSDGADVPGASGPEYPVQAGDVGKTFTCIVTASTIGGSTTAPPSNPVVVAGALGATGTVSRR